MPRFGIVVEGLYDKEVIRHFIAKCHGAECEIEARTWAEHGGLTAKFRISLEEFKYLGGIEKAFVIRDADRRDPGQLLAQMKARVTGRAYPFPVKFVLAIQEMEAWLLADHDAISRVTGRPIQRQLDPIEGIDSPKERLAHLLSVAGVGYTAEVARQIAAEADVQTLAVRCPAFGAFCQDARDC